MNEHTYMCWNERVPNRWSHSLIGANWFTMVSSICEDDDFTQTFYSNRTKSTRTDHNRLIREHREFPAFVYISRVVFFFLNIYREWKRKKESHLVRLVFLGFICLHKNNNNYQQQKNYENTCMPDKGNSIQRIYAYEKCILQEKKPMMSSYELFIVL